MVPALASFIAQAGIFDGPSGLLVCKKSMRTIVSLVVIYRNLKHIIRALLGILFNCCKPTNPPRVENL